MTGNETRIAVRRGGEQRAEVLFVGEDFDEAGFEEKKQRQGMEEIDERDLVELFQRHTISVNLAQILDERWEVVKRGVEELLRVCEQDGEIAEGDDGANTWIEFRVARDNGKESSE